MKALSLMQPWATLAVMGLKKIETRTWATDYRGPLFIHASKSRAGKALIPLLHLPENFPGFNELPVGCIIGEVRLADITRGSALKMDEKRFQHQSFEAGAFGDFRVKYCWMLEEGHIFDEPVAATGRLGLWEF